MIPSITAACDEVGKQDRVRLDDPRPIRHAKQRRLRQVERPPDRLDVQHACAPSCSRRVVGRSPARTGPPGRPAPGRQAATVRCRPQGSRGGQTCRCRARRRSTCHGRAAPAASARKRSATSEMASPGPPMNGTVTPVDVPLGAGTDAYQISSVRPSGFAQSAGTVATPHGSRRRTAPDTPRSERDRMTQHPFGTLRCRGSTRGRRGLGGGPDRRPRGEGRQSNTRAP